MEERQLDYLLKMEIDGEYQNGLPNGKCEQIYSNGTKYSVIRKLGIVIPACKVDASAIVVEL